MSLSFSLSHCIGELLAFGSAVSSAFMFTATTDSGVVLFKNVLPLTSHPSLSVSLLSGVGVPLHLAGSAALPSVTFTTNERHTVCRTSPIFYDPGATSNYISRNARPPFLSSIVLSFSLSSLSSH
jgi:hypothetical protein